jgi:inorganic phosphate transporter, PiT family
MRAAYLPSERTFHGHCFCVFRNGSKTQPRSQSYRPSGAVAVGIVSLLPVELILQVGSNAGFAMVFALLMAAILWNLGTWWLGLPASSSHTLIGSIIGVGIANQLMSLKSGTSGVDWAQALSIGKSLLLSPILRAISIACDSLAPRARHAW